MNNVVEEILTSRKTIGRNGEIVDIHSEISGREGRFIFDQIAGDHTIVKTLEVGCAFGLSSLHICEALRGRKDAHHIIIDPFQTSDWFGAGIHALDRAGFDFYELVEEKSEFALPKILRESGEESFDFIFIDGWHTFDHTLVDCFYANRLLRPGGILMVDDCDFAPVMRAVKYIANYPCYKYAASITDYPDHPLLNLACRAGRMVPMGIDMRYRLPAKLRQLLRRPNMIALHKTASDERRWNWYKPF